MPRWDWNNSNYRNHAGDAAWLLRDALRRAVDIRDAVASGELPSGRAVMLVDVLNSLKDAIGIDPRDTGADWLWSETE